MAVEGRSFIGIGKILIDTPAEEWNIPSLHFVVSRSDEKTYEAVNLEFGLVSIGESETDAAGGLATLTCAYIVSVIKNGNGYKELRETVRNNFMSDYWTEYRGIEFDLAETGGDLSHYLDTRINKAIWEAFNEEFEKALKREAASATREIMSLLSVRPLVVEYKEIRQEQTAA